MRKTRGNYLGGSRKALSHLSRSREKIVRLRATSGNVHAANDTFASCCRKTSRPRSQPTYPRRITTQVSKTFHYPYTRGPCCSSIRVRGDQNARRGFYVTLLLYTRSPSRRKNCLTEKNKPLFVLCNYNTNRRIGIEVCMFRK